MLALCATAALAFTLPTRPAVASARSDVMMAAIRITGSNIEVTEALKSHVEAKLSVPLEKFSAILNDASDVEMHIKVEKRGVHDEDHTGRSAHIAEVTAQLKGPHKSVTVSSESEDMYATIDELEARLARSLRKAKEKQQDVKINRGAKSKVGMEDDTLVDAEDDGADAMA